MADDIDIDLEKMSLWSRKEACAYFESGGEVEPAARKGNKELDIIVAGATGVVGRWLCQMLEELQERDSRTSGQLLADGESPPKWGIAGRPSARLNELAKKHGVRKFELIEGERESFDAVTSAASLILAVAGPYLQATPRQLAAACARAKWVAYFDLTGEYPYVSDVAELHDAEAKGNGTALIHMLGPQECCVTEVTAVTACLHVPRHEGE